MMFMLGWFNKWVSDHGADENNYKIFRKTRYDGEHRYMIKRKNILGFWAELPTMEYRILERAKKRVFEEIEKHKNSHKTRIKSIEEVKSKKQRLVEYTNKL